MSTLDAKAWLTAIGLLQLGILCWAGKVPGEALATTTTAVLVAVLGASFAKDVAAKVAEVRIAKLAKEKA